MTNASVTEANTHGASGMAQLNARAVPCPAGTDGSGPLRAVADEVTGARCTAMTAATVATKTMAAAIPNDTRMPGCEQLAVLLVSVGWADLSDLSTRMWGWPTASCVSGVG
jgi:hypothetical protein